MKIEEEIKQKKFRNPLQKVAINLFFTASWLQNQQQQFFKPFGITPAQFNILRILRGQVPNKISGAEIKSRMLDKNSDIPRLLDRLISKKLISKTPCPNDKRAADITITEKGLDVLKQIDPILDSTEKANLHLTGEEAIQLSNLLDKARG
ncbi:MAG: MarR family transcriptional regulator [Bacteroidetes bacterium]|nr:MarR family transcriptional regulator [Bacteroidota bacterium]MBS1977990.1 MarR family transcriptional regulator [Bacteroidota bacterium]